MSRLARSVGTLAARLLKPIRRWLLLEDLHALGLIKVHEAAFQDTIGHKFLINLMIGGPGSGLSREQLVVLGDAEATGMDDPVFETPAVDEPGWTA